MNAKYGVENLFNKIIYQKFSQCQVKTSAYLCWSASTSMRIWHTYVPRKKTSNLTSENFKHKQLIATWGIPLMRHLSLCHSNKSPLIYFLTKIFAIQYEDLEKWKGQRELIVTAFTKIFFQDSTKFPLIQYYQDTNFAKYHNIVVIEWKTDSQT